MTIGERIKNAREKAGYGLTELAEKMNISKQLLYKYETGKVKTVPSDKIELIAKCCHIDPWDIMGWNPDQNNGQQSYYTNEETQQIAQEVYENPDLRLVFDACKGLSPEQIQAAANMLKVFKGDT